MLVTAERFGPGLRGGSTLGSSRKEGMTQFLGPQGIVSGGDVEAEGRENHK